MKKRYLNAVILIVLLSFAAVVSGCNMVAEEARWYIQNVKEKGLYSASLEFTENALVIGGAAAIVAPEIGIVLGLYAIDGVSEMDTRETILTVGNVAGFAAGTVLILAPAAAISAVGLVTQGVPDNYDGSLFSGFSFSNGDECHRDYDCAGSVCDEGVCRLAIEPNECMSDSYYGAYNWHCMEYKTPNAVQEEPACLLDIDCANGLCLDGRCASEIKCTSRSDCPLSNHACINGVCLVYKDCATEQDCLDRDDGSSFCTAELECVDKLECTKASDCAGDSICYQDVCIDCRFNAECSDGLLCFNGHCTASDAVPDAAKK